MQSEDNNSNNNLPYQDNHLNTALIVEKSPRGRIKVLSNDRVILKRTESGRLLPFKLPEGAAFNEELSENAYGLPRSSVYDVQGKISIPPSTIEHEMVHEPSPSIDEANFLLESAPPRPPANDDSFADILPTYLVEALAIDSGSEESDDEEYTEETIRQILESNDDDIEEEEFPPALTDGASWSSDFQTFTGVQEFYTEQPGPTITVTDPFELFSSVWDQNIMDLIVRETNKYAWQTIAQLSEVGIKPESRLNDWVEVTVEELYKFFSIMIYMGLCYRGRIDEYWTTDTLEMPQFRQLMSKNRFLLILRFLHFVDNDYLDLTLHGNDRKTSKIAPILDHCNRKFKEMYVPEQHLSLDESLLLWKGRLSWIQCICRSPIV
uniref:PiggyBac transposable element-derived protein domain-containing protein n=1 Tax=Heliothis virescens TaxID=7102 RepID=A0A2A4J3L8_HELVI